MHKGIVADYNGYIVKPKNEETYVGLDIGTSKVVCVVGLHQEDSPTPSIIGLGESPNSGLRRGIIVDLEETVSSITEALEQAERMSGIAIERATISVDGSHIQNLTSKGVIAISRSDHEITPEEIKRAEKAATAIQLEPNRQILEVSPLSYSVDDQKDINDPIGMSGVRLEVDTNIITASTPAIKNLHNSIFRSGVKISGQLLVSEAAAKTLLTKKQIEQGVVLIHFGSETTGLLVYNEGKPVYTSVLPVGSNYITKDIVYGLSIDMDSAERLKIEYGFARTPNPRKQQKIDLERFGCEGEVNQADLDKIIYARLNEIFEILSEEVSKLKYSNHLSAGIILTGGGSNLREIENFAKSYFKLPIKLGKSYKYTGVSDKISDPTYAAAIGLMLDDMERPRHSKTGGFSFNLGPLSQRIKAVFKSLTP